MWSNILFFTLIFLFKNILLDIFFNYSQTFLFAFELASLSIFDREYIWTNYIKWIFVGFIGFNSETKLLTYLDDYTRQDSYIFFLIWLFTFVISQIYYLIKYFHQKNNKNLLLHMKKSNVKFILNNYLPLYLWNLSELINPNSFGILSFMGFINKFFHLILSCFMVFVVPSLIFNIIYGNNFFLNRQKYSFLIDNFHKANKGHYIIILFFKILLGIFVTFYFYFTNGNNYSIISINFLYILYNLISNYCYHPIYQEKKNSRFNLLYLFASLIISIIGQINIYITNSNTSFILEIIEISIMGVMFISTIIQAIKVVKKNKRIKNYRNNSEIELALQ